MVNGCAHRRRREEETRDREAAPERNYAYYSYRRKEATNLTRRPSFYLLFFVVSLSFMHHWVNQKKATKHVRKLPVLLLMNCGAMQRQVQRVTDAAAGANEKSSSAWRTKQQKAKRMEIRGKYFEVPSWLDSSIYTHRTGAAAHTGDPVVCGHHSQLPPKLSEA